jgi:hypothetical protein
VRRRLAICSLAWLPALGGCGIFDRDQVPPKEPAVAPEQQYLAHRSPAAGLEVGPGQKTMLETLNEVQEERVALGQRIEALEAEKKELLARVVAVETERDQEKALRVSAVSERDEARQQSADRDARLLNLAIQKTQLEQEVLLMKISQLEAGRAGAKGTGRGTEMEMEMGREPGGPDAGREPASRERPYAGPGVDR